MKAAVFTKPRSPLVIHDYPLPRAKPGMAVVNLVCSGLCGTDIHIWEGALEFAGPIVIGHEFVGRIAQLGEGAHTDCLGQTIRPGDLVVANVVEPCGVCALCSTGGEASCLRLSDSLTYTRSVLEPPHFHGGFAEVTVVPTRYLHRLPDAIPPFVAAAFLCAGPTVIRGLTYAGGIQPGEHVVIQGSGPVGLFAVLIAKQCGAASVTMIGSGSHPLRLELARALGAGTVLDIRATTVEQRRKQVLEQTGGIGADMIIEGAGHPDAIPEGLGLLRPRGRYVWAGQYSDRGPVLFPTHAVTLNALQIIGSAQFTVADRVAYFELLEQTRDQWPDISRVVTDRFYIDEINEAFAKARQGGSIKTVFVPG